MHVLCLTGQGQNILTQKLSEIDYVNEKMKIMKMSDNVVSEDYVNEESVNALNATICQWKLAAAPLS